MAAWPSGIGLILVLLTASVCRPGGESTRQAPQPTARVTFLQGTAQFERDGNSQGLSFGAFLLAGDLVKTGDKSQLELFIKGKGVIRLGSNAQARVAELGKNTRLELTKGDAAVFLKRQGRDGDFSVRTPTAVAAVRGTVFLVRAESTGSSRVSLVSGQVEVSAHAGGSVVLEAGREVIISNAELTQKMVRPLSKEALAVVRRLAVFHRNNILEHAALLDELKADPVLGKLEVRESVEGRYAKLRDGDRPTHAVKQAKSVGEEVIRKDIDADRLKLRPKRGFDSGAN